MPKFARGSDALRILISPLCGQKQKKDASVS